MDILRIFFHLLLPATWSSFASNEVRERGFFIIELYDGIEVIVVFHVASVEEFVN